MLDSFASFAGPGRLASDLAPDDFLRYRRRLSRQDLILLRSNGGFGNSDCAALPISADVEVAGDLVKRVRGAGRVCFDS